MDYKNDLKDPNVRAAIAQRCGVTPQAITNWMSRGFPAEHCPDIEDLTGIRCEVLRPDVNWTVLRAKVAHKRNVHPVQPVCNH